MSYSRLEVEVIDRVGHIKLNQPEEYNRMPPAFWQEFPQALTELDASGEVRAVVVSSTGKHFTAGLDVSAFTSGGSGAKLDPGRQGEQGRRKLRGMQDVFSKLEQIRMPVLTAIQGGCIGGGVDLIAASDMRYCTDDAFFCVQEINIGLAADVGTLQRLPKLIPEGMMRELAYTGRRMHADEAYRIGLVNQTFPHQEAMLQAVLGIAAEITRKSPLATASTKHLLHYGKEHSIADTLDYQAVWMSGVSQSGEIQRYFAAKSKGEEPEYDNLPPID